MQTQTTGRAAAFRPALPTNDELAGVLEQMAEALVTLGEPNPYRVQAYLTAAETLRADEQPLAARYGAGGRKALMELPGVGTAIATHLAQYLETGRAGLRDRLLTAVDPAKLLGTVPGLGGALARRVVDELGVDSLAELERACYDGRLLALEGFGPRRLEALKLQLNTILHRAARRRLRRVRRQLARMAALDRAAEVAAEHAEEAAALAGDEAADAAPPAVLPGRIIPLFPPAAA
jgi:DNA polymerase/3'-5' exonuclease PolX